MTLREEKSIKPRMPGRGLALLLLAITASMLETIAGAIHCVVEGVHAGLGWAVLLMIGLPFAIAVGGLLWSGISLTRAILDRRSDSALAILRCVRFSLYLAVISTFISWSMWSRFESTNWLGLLAVLLVNGLPLLACLYVLRSLAVHAWLGSGFVNRMGEAGLKLIARDAAIVVILMLVSLVGVLTVFSIPSIRTFGWTFVTSREWRPNSIDEPVRSPEGKLVYDEDGNQLTKELPPAFGALPVIWGTTVSSVIAMLFAVPLSFGAAIFLVRVARPNVVAPISFLIEFLAAIPSIAYGIWGLFVMCPFLQGSLSLPHSISWMIRVRLFGSFFHKASPAVVAATIGQPKLQQYVYAGTREPLVYFNGIEPWLNHFFSTTPGLDWLASPTGGVTGRDMLAGGLILGIMVVPIVTAISRDVLASVPLAQLEGSVALGATWWESSREMLKYSRSGLFGAVMLGLARAAGETMAITMVIGNNTQIQTSLFAPAQTMSSLLANEFAEAGGELQRSALTELALILLLMSFVFNIVARYLVVGKRSRSTLLV